MAMDPVFAWIESSGLSEWVRGSDCICAFPTIVTLHNVGMAFLAGGNIAIDLRLLGFARSIPLKPLARFVPLLWLAFATMAASGTLLFIGYPTKALTNPLFYFKLVLIGVAFCLVYRLGAEVLAVDTDQKCLAPRTKIFAVASLLVWLSLIAAGRFLGYTHRWELLNVPAVL
jgi:Family of unknown function (DUF6644)